MIVLHVGRLDPRARPYTPRGTHVRRLPTKRSVRRQKLAVRKRVRLFEIRRKQWRAQKIFSRGATTGRVK
jgi:hypothetical protein